MNKLLILCLLGLSFNVNALTKSEIVCASQNIYFEAREDKVSWIKVLQVANNRKSNPKKYGARSSHLCDIVHSSQYKTHKLRHIKEKDKYKEILKFVVHHKQLVHSNLTYFSGKHKLHFRNKF